MNFFEAHGYSTTGLITCCVDGADIYQVDALGNRKILGKTQAAHDELSDTTQQYYDKLVEMGIIVPQKPPEVLMAEMQDTMLKMSKIIAGLSDEMKELKRNGHQQCACHGGENVSGGGHQRGGGKGKSGDSGDGK